MTNKLYASIFVINGAVSCDLHDTEAEAYQEIYDHVDSNWATEMPPGSEKPEDPEEAAMKYFEYHEGDLATVAPVFYKKKEVHCE